jgi:hypothetical protein
MKKYVLLMSVLLIGFIVILRTRDFENRGYSNIFTNSALCR